MWCINILGQDIVKLSFNLTFNILQIWFLTTHLLIKGGTYTVAIIKTAMATPMSQQVFYSSTVFEDVQFYCPWGLILGIIGCFFTFVSAAGPMDVLIQNKTHNDVNDYQTLKNTNQGILQQYSYPIIVPPGYHETFGLKVPIVYWWQKRG